MGKIITVLGGEFIHQTSTQFHWLSKRAPAGWTFRIHDSATALEDLPEADLFIAAGLHWSGSETVPWTDPAPYIPPTEPQKAGLRDYVTSGRPVLGFHGGIASFDDWPEFATLLGFQWHWSITTHGPRQRYDVYPVEREHPVMQGVEDFRLLDENYHHIQLLPGIKYETLARMNCGDFQLPMVMTCPPGRLSGAGLAGYFALGHDMVALEHPMCERIFWNLCHWIMNTE